MQQIFLNDFRRQWQDLGQAAIAAFARVGESGWYVLGKEVELFEQAITTYWNLRYAIGCASGLDAIEMGLRVLGLKPGEHVLTTPLSAFATTLAIYRAGGVPVFVDIDAHGQIDLAMVEQVCARDASLKTLTPVHLYGHAIDLDRLAWLRHRYDLRVVEDCAQAIGATWQGRQVGNVGQLAATSFYPTKNLGAMGDGGAVLTNDPELAAKARVLRDYGQKSKYEHVSLGLNSRLDEIHAAILRDAMLPRLVAWTVKRRAIANTYLTGLNNSHVDVIVPAAGAESVWHLFPVRVYGAGKRDVLKAWLAQQGVQSAVHYPRVIPDQPALQAGVIFESVGDLTNARALAEAELSLPIHPYLSDTEVRRVIDIINHWKG